MENKIRKELYIVGAVVTVGVIIILFLKPKLDINRKVYACPTNFGARCINAEAEYKSTCSKQGQCMYYYTKLFVSSRETIVFEYCDEAVKIQTTCYEKGNGKGWSLQYIGDAIKK